MAASKETLIMVATASSVGRVWPHPSADEVRIYVGRSFATLSPDGETTDGLDLVRVHVGHDMPQRGGKRTRIANAVRAAGMYPVL